MAQQKPPRKAKKETIKCRKCGLDSPSEAKFCPNCGAKIGAPPILISRPLPSLAFLYFAGGAYLIITAIVNPLVQASLLLLIPYIIIGVLGLFVGWQFYSGKRVRKWTRGLSLAVGVVGATITIAMYVLGFRLERLIGPAWVIFVFNGWALIRDWSQI